MKLKVNKDLCIGCGACQATCPEVFQFKNDEYASVIVDEIKEELIDDAMDAMDGCPTGAIEKIEK